MERRVLVVDDHADTTEVLSIMFEFLGCETRGEHSGEAALRAVHEFDPHLIVLDIGLPDMDGYELAHAMRSMRSGRFIVALSGWGRRVDRERASFDDYLQKPIELSGIRRILHSAGLRATC
jgi:CheY-like chemotaxis protein